MNFSPPTPDWWRAETNAGHWVYALFAPLPGNASAVEAQCVYVGMTSSLRHRLRSHASKWWWPTIAPHLCRFIECDTRKDAVALEARLIVELKPALNQAGSPEWAEARRYHIDQAVGR